MRPCPVGGEQPDYTSRCTFQARTKWSGGRGLKINLGGQGEMEQDFNPVRFLRSLMQSPAKI